MSNFLNGYITLSKFINDNNLSQPGIKKLIQKYDIKLSKVAGVYYLNEKDIEQYFVTEIAASAKERALRIDARRKKNEIKKKITEVSIEYLNALADQPDLNFKEFLDIKIETDDSYKILDNLIVPTINI